MGCVGSKEAYLAESGTLVEFKALFDEQGVLGQGEFGVVTRVCKKGETEGPSYAAKVTLR